MARKTTSASAFLYTAGLAGLFLLFMGLWLLALSLWAEPGVVIRGEITYRQLEPGLPLRCGEDLTSDDAKIRNKKRFPNFFILCACS